MRGGIPISFVSVFFVSAAASGAAEVRSIPTVPLGFAKTGDGYSASVANGFVEIEASRVGFRANGATWGIDFEGASPHSRLSAIGDAGTRNELIGNRQALWKIGIPLRERVRVESVWPGIDAVYYGNQKRLEYDFIVAPGIAPGLIRMTPRSARTELDAEGNLHLKQEGADLVHHRPVAYQQIRGERIAVESRFVIERGGKIRFALGLYDTRYPLVIDPSVSFASYVGGTDTDEARAIAVDMNGNLYVAGKTFSTKASNAQAMLLKVPATGSPTLSIIGGTNGNDWANAVTTDASGNVYLGGQASSSDFPGVVSGVFQPQLAFGIDGFVSALPPSNNGFIFTTYVGGSTGTDGGAGTDIVNAVAVAKNGNVYAAGETNSLDFPTTANNVFQAAIHGGYDAFLIGLGSNGGAGFSTYVGGSAEDIAYGLITDSNSDCYVVGSTASEDFPTTPNRSDLPYPAFQTTLGGGKDAFAIKVFGTGAYAGQLARWSTFIGGTSDDVAYGVALDADMNVYVTGATTCTSGQTGGFPYSGGYQSTCKGGTDGFAFKLRKDGSKGLWSTFLGGAGDDFLNGVATDGAGNVWLVGDSGSDDFPLTDNAIQNKRAGGSDAVIAELSSDGTLLPFSTYFGGSGDDLGTGIALDANGTVYLSGITASSSDLPVTSSSYQPQYGGGTTDGFFAAFAFSPTVNSGGIVNGGTFRADPVSPGSLISIFGSALATSATGASTLPLPTSLGGVSVQVNGSSIPLLYVSPTQINAQLPFETQLGAATIVVNAPGGTSNAQGFIVAAAGPGILVYNGAAVAQNFPDYSLNTATNGMKPGGTVIVYFTGAGAVNPPAPSGAAAPSSPLAQPAQEYSATIGGNAATVSFMGLTPGYAGLAQANVTVPASLSPGSYPVVLTIGSVSSPGANITVSGP